MGLCRCLLPAHRSIVFALRVRQSLGRIHSRHLSSRSHTTVVVLQTGRPKSVHARAWGFSHCLRSAPGGVRHVLRDGVPQCFDRGSRVVTSGFALAGLRANEARYFNNKYDHVFTVEPASEAYTVEHPNKRAVGFKLSDGMEVPEELASKFKFARQKSRLAGTIRGSYFAFKKEYWPPDLLCCGPRRPTAPTGARRHSSRRPPPSPSTRRRSRCRPAGHQRRRGGVPVRRRRRRTDAASVTPGTTATAAVQPPLDAEQPHHYGGWVSLLSSIGRYESDELARKQVRETRMRASSRDDWLALNSKLGNTLAAIDTRQGDLGKTTPPRLRGPGFITGAHPGPLGRRPASAVCRIG